MFGENTVINHRDYRIKLINVTDFLKRGTKIKSYI